MAASRNLQTAEAAAIGQQLLKELHCSICTNLIFPNVYSCANGHLICVPCINMLGKHSCPTCKDSRGFQLNSYISRFVQNLEMEVPCRYNTEGCDLKGTTEKLSQHMFQCLFRPMNCKFSPECEEERKLVHFLDIEKHLTNVHRDEVTKSGFNTACCFLEPQENLNGPWTVALNTYNHMENNLMHYFWLGSKHILGVKLSRNGAAIWLIEMGHKEPKEKGRIVVIQEKSAYMASYEGFPIVPLNNHKFEPDTLHCATIPMFVLDNVEYAPTKLLVRIGAVCTCPVPFGCNIHF